MAILKAIARAKRSESLRGAFMVDTVRGVLRVRKWPRKRGTPKSERQLWWIDWFRQANRLAKYADGMTMARAIALTKGSGIYPRDIILKAMRGRLYIWQDQTGKVWYPMAAVQDISESLDVLAQNLGSILVRAADRWRAVPAGSFNDVLTYKGVGEQPVWQAGSGGGGGSQEVLAGTPILPDGTQNSYDLDVSAYKTLNIQVTRVLFAGGDRLAIRLSTDGGVTFHDAAGEYETGFACANWDGWVVNDTIDCFRLDQTVEHNGVINLSNLHAGRATWNGMTSYLPIVAYAIGGLANFDSPVTDIRIMSKGGRNITAGTLRFVGTT